MAKKAASSAPKKSDVNKSQAIRAYLKAHRGAKPLAVVEALKDQGIDVSAQTVSTVKFNMKKKKGKGRKRTAGAESTNGDKISLSALIEAKKLVDKVGSLDKVKSALKALDSLS
jgi:hypothetical protein